MKKVYKEKMENAKDEKEAYHKGKFESGGGHGCFPAMFKRRIHSDSVQNSDSAEKVRT